MCLIGYASVQTQAITRAGPQFLADLCGGVICALTMAVMSSGVLSPSPSRAFRMKPAKWQHQFEQTRSAHLILLRHLRSCCTRTYRLWSSLVRGLEQQGCRRTWGIDDGQVRAVRIPTQHSHASEFPYHDGVMQAHARMVRAPGLRIKASHKGGASYHSWQGTAPCSSHSRICAITAGLSRFSRKAVRLAPSSLHLHCFS